jgi:hypothetical protein
MGSRSESTSNAKRQGKALVVLDESNQI